MKLQFLIYKMVGFMYVMHQDELTSQAEFSMVLVRRILEGLTYMRALSKPRLWNLS